MSPFGSMTLLPPAWPEVDEDILAAAAGSYEGLARHIQGVAIPQLQQQLMALAESWSGTAAQAAQAEATSIIGEHGANAEQATAIAGKLRQMLELAVRTKMAVNAIAQEVQAACEAIEATPDDPGVKQAAQAQQVAMGLAQNIATVAAGSGQVGGGLGGGLGEGLGVSPGSGPAGAGGDPMQAMEMVMQLAPMLLSQISQLPAQLGSLAGGATSPLPQIPATFGQLASTALPAGGPGVLSPFSNHPMAGGSGLTRGAGLLRGMSIPRLPSLPGLGHGPAGSPHPQRASGRPAPGHVLAGASGSSTGGGRPHAGPAGRPGVGTATAPSAGVHGGGRPGVAPVGAGGPERAAAASAPVGAGGTPAMGERGTTGGSRAATPIPARLHHDLAEDADDDW
ncbi:hypothetical protein [Mycolicibacter acidiphilus]|nr:hypothetical protein [Mycolicibacter acidiphilus]